jgi:hypothetical protein
VLAAATTHLRDFLGPFEAAPKPSQLAINILCEFNGKRVYIYEKLISDSNTTIVTYLQRMELSVILATRMLSTISTRIGSPRSRTPVLIWGSFAPGIGADSQHSRPPGTGSQVMAGARGPIIRRGRIVKPNLFN